MSDTSRADVLVDIRSKTDTTGTDATIKSLDQLRDKADVATASTNEMGKASIGAGHLLHGLEMAAQGSGRGLFAAGNGARHLLESLGAGALSGYALLLTGIAAAAQAVVGWFEKQAEAAKKAADDQDKLQDKAEKANQLNFEMAIEQYKHLTDKIDAAAQAQEKLNDARLKMMKADTAQKVASLELEESKELAKLAHDDDIGRKRVKVKYAGLVKTVEDEGVVAEAQQELSSAKEKADSATVKENRESGLLAIEQRKLDQATRQRDYAVRMERQLRALRSEAEELHENLNTMPQTGPGESGYTTEQQKQRDQMSARLAELEGPTWDQLLTGTPAQKGLIKETEENVGHIATPEKLEAANKLVREQQRSVFEAQASYDKAHIEAVSAQQLIPSAARAVETAGIKQDNHLMTNATAKIDEDSSAEAERKKKAAEAAAKAKRLKEDQDKLNKEQSELTAEQRQKKAIEDAEAALHAGNQRLQHAEHNDAAAHQQFHGKINERSLEAPFDRDLARAQADAHAATARLADATKGLTDGMKGLLAEIKKHADEINRLKETIANLHSDVGSKS